MAEIRINISYDDLTKLIAKDPDILLEIRNGIISTFTEKYIKDMVQQDVKTLDNGVLREVIKTEMLQYFTGATRYGTYTELLPKIKADIAIQLKELQRQLVEESNAVTLQGAIKKLSDLRDELYLKIETTVSKEITEQTELTIKKLVDDRFTAIYDKIKNDI